MRHLRVAAAFFLVVYLSSCTLWNKPAKGWSGATGGEQLEKLFWEDVRTSNLKSLDQHVAATLMAIGPAGAQDRDAFLRQLQAAASTKVVLRDCSSKLNGADLMVACVVERAAREGLSRTANTLSVWQQLPKGWMMVAHAETAAEPGKP